MSLKKKNPKEKKTEYVLNLSTGKVTFKHPHFSLLEGSFLYSMKIYNHW